MENLNKLMKTRAKTVQSMVVKNRRKMESHFASTSSGFFDEQQSVLMETLNQKQEHVESRIEEIRHKRERDFRLKNELVSLKKQDQERKRLRMKA